VFACGIWACAHASHDDVPKAMIELRAATADHQRNDVAGFLAHCQAAVDAAPRHPTARYDLACAHAMAGNAGEAVAELDRLAAEPVLFDVDHDTDFDRIRQTPAFVAYRERAAAVRARRVERSRVAFSLAERDLLTEGIAHDDASGDFFVSSVHHHKIVRVGKDGRARDFASETYGVLALAVDAPRHLLWACTSAMPEVEGYTQDLDGRAALVALDLASAAPRRRIELSSAGRHNCNDLAIDPNGVVFVSDPLAHHVLRLDGETLTPIAELPSPQGIVIDGHALLVADYSLGIVRVEDGKVTPLPAQTVLTGTDGLCAVPGGDLVAIRNGVEPARALRLRLSSDRSRITAIEVLDLNHSAYHEPTLCTMVGRDLYYIGAAQWERKEPLSRSVILTTHLD